MSYSVGELSRLAGVSVRALHHYDEIGLLAPSERTAAGYRQYSDADARRLHRILVYRELGFDLGRIAVILNDPADDLAQLAAQRALLHEQLDRIQRMLAGVEAMMSAKQEKRAVSNEELKEIFDGFDHSQYEAEVEERWGDTDAYRESARRTKQYGKAEWQQIKTEAEAITSAMAEACRGGLPADGAVATALAERHRLHIDRWFYPCSHEMQCCLAEMYVADARFAASYDQHEPGLSAYVRAAILANAQRTRRE